MSVELWRKRYRKAPEIAVKREVQFHESIETDALPPILCVTGNSHGASLFSDNWLPHIAQRGHNAYAVSVRGQGETPDAPGKTDARVHDVVQTAVSLPTRCILIGHDVGASWVTHALTRYPALAGILVAPRGIKTSPGNPLAECRVLVTGSPDDKKSGQKVLDRVAAAYGVAPLLFPGVGHDFMNDTGWQAPLDAILDWIAETSGTTNTE